MHLPFLAYFPENKPKTGPERKISTLTHFHISIFKYQHIKTIHSITHSLLHAFQKEAPKHMCVSGLLFGNEG